MQTVPFVKVNVNKCLCPRCPVQIHSICVGEKMAELKDHIDDVPLTSYDIPCVYCASGAASCSDIKSDKDCSCGKCVVFIEYKLFDYSPNGHYCANGSVKENNS